MHDLTITHYDKPVLALSVALLDRQNAWHNVEALKEAHQLKLVIMVMMNETDDAEELKSLAQDVQLVEFELQRLWNFPQDAKFHRPWQLPKCSCPSMDNEERWGAGVMVTNANCLLHGN